MPDRDQQRENKRPDNSDCQDPVSLNDPLGPPLRSAKDCDPDIPVPDPDEFFEPETCDPIPPEALVVPNPLVIGNDEYTATCPTAEKPGDTGSNVTVVVDTFTDVFNFGDIPDINGNQLTFLSNLSSGDRDTLADPATLVADIETITHLSTAQATFINDTVTTLKNNLNAIAQASAESQIICLFENVEQSVTCVDGGFAVDAYVNGGEPLGKEDEVNNPSVVVAASYTSAVSQAQADAAANDAAIAALGCLYGNDETTVECTDIGYTEAVPNDISVISYDGRLRVGSVTIAADTVFSNTDKPNANAIAAAVAESQLVCFYINAQYDTDCDTIGKVGTAAGPADVEASQSGNPVSVPQGFIQSDVDTATADAAAVSLGDSLLECYWENAEQCADCPPTDVTNPDDPGGDDITVTALDPGPLCVSAGEIRSYVSQADADTQAQTSADAQLICVYCNPQIDPKCEPDLYAGPIPIPADEPDSTWSLSATRGLAAGDICANDPEDVINVAVGLANVPADVTSSDDCCYGNDQVEAECPAGVDATKSSPKVVIAADTIIVCDSDAAAAGWGGTTKDYATDLADKLAQAALFCVWSNVEVTRSCTQAGLPIPDVFHPSILAPDDLTTNTVAAGEVISFQSQVEADAIADAIALSALTCLYINSPFQTGAGCPAGTNTLQIGFMAAGSVISPESTADANNISQAIADGLSVCIDPNDAGAPGNDGAQDNCDGDCYGYYS